MPLTSADYGGGLVITDWYSEQDNSRDSIKISVRFLSNEIRSDGLEIVVFSKKCDANVNCKVIKNNSEIENELKIAILKRAAKYKKERIDKNPKISLDTIKAPQDKWSNKSLWIDITLRQSKINGKNFGKKTILLNPLLKKIKSFTA